MTILIIEDDAGVAEVLVRYFKGVADEVLVAGTMAEALAYIRGSKDYDVVTLDVNLPDSRGEETLQRIAEIKERQAAALVVVLTGAMDKRDAERAILAGADAFLTKADSMTSQGGFLANLRDVFGSLVSQPSHYQRNIELLERLSKGVVEHFKKPN